MLSNRITAKSLELNPARQARKRMLNESKDCHPAGCVSPPDRPPLPPPPPAAPGRLFPCTEPPALVDALCLPSLAACCSAISARSVGWICSCPAPRLSPRSATVVYFPMLCPLLSGILSSNSFGCKVWFNLVSLLRETAVTSRNAHSCATYRGCNRQSASRLNAGGEGREGCERRALGRSGDLSQIDRYEGAGFYVSRPIRETNLLIRQKALPMKTEQNYGCNWLRLGLSLLYFR